MIRILANTTYARLFAAQVIALLGTGLMTVALGLLAYDLAGDRAGDPGHGHADARQDGQAADEDHEVRSTPEPGRRVELALTLQDRDLRDEVARHLGLGRHLLRTQRLVGGQEDGRRPARR